MTEYHEDNFCAACDGPLECYRDAICESCAPQSQYFEECATMQVAVDLVDRMRIRMSVSAMTQWRRRLKFRRQRAQ